MMPQVIAPTRGIYCPDESLSEFGASESLVTINPHQGVALIWYIRDTVFGYAKEPS
jgi:hypothetical protein